MDKAVFTSRETGVRTEHKALIARPEYGVARVRCAARAKRGAPPLLGFCFLLVCIAAFSLLLALKLSGAERNAVAVFGSGSEGADESDDARLGKLKLISLPGLITVFAPSDRPILPLKTEGGTVRDDMIARICAPAGTEVLSVLEGRVRSVSTVPGGDEGAPFGGSVTVSHDGGIEITYYGLGTIAVERGQRVLQRTVLGTLERDILFLRVTKDGRPIDPLEYLGVAARLG
ncbi:MAG: M23 family metallopeptidase [Clostridia bacterium]|nr:M23 family metallopeptidase [Clostridia bacterium]